MATNSNNKDHPEQYTNPNKYTENIHNHTRKNTTGQTISPHNGSLPQNDTGRQRSHTDRTYEPKKYTSMPEKSYTTFDPTHQTESRTVPHMQTI